MKLLGIIQLSRPHQYLKNLFIFMPIFFALRITELPLLQNAILAFIAFSITASAIYMLNDYHDIEEDRQHPKKKHRPLASGVITKSEATVVMSLFFGAGFCLMGLVNAHALIILGIYVGLNIAYSLYLKNIAIVDIMIIASGFVLRLFIGSTVTGITLSSWIVIMTFLLALFMALAKRRDDLLIYLDTGKKMRKAINGYNLQFLDSAMVVMATVVIVAYTMYVTSIQTIERMNSEYLYLTAFFVILGILRYLQISLVLQDSGSPTKIVIRDHFLQITLIAWIATFVWILY
ncbi:MAG TPA: decaprenyl-phosphate phosphoribosyltransferase [Bacteroidetes bacterium]|nr:decaprenyl-phosphate phosphoribosyltransferase [Bacteroidota bacterium]